MHPVLLLIVGLAVVIGFFTLLGPSPDSPYTKGGTARERIAAARSAFLASDLGAVTLEQAKLNTQDDIALQVIDEFRKSSWLLDHLVFDDVVSPAGGGSTLTHGYTRLVTQPTAAFRAINSEYTPSEVTRQRFTTDLKVLGGSFQIDRVVARLGPAASGEVELQMSQKIKAARTLFAQTVILGDSAVNAESFDGLSKALAGSSTEITAGPGSDFSAVTDRLSGIQAMKWIRRMVAKLDGPPSALLMNTDALSALQTVAEITSQLTELSAFGQTVTAWRGIPLIDLGERMGSSDPVIGTVDPDSTVYTATINGVPTGGSFKLRITVDGNDDETDAIAYNANAAAVDSAIEGTGVVPAGGVAVTGTFVLAFGGALAGKDVKVELSSNDLTGGTNPTVALQETGNVGGLTDIYAVRLGLDGFHGLSTIGGQLVDAWPPDFTKAGAVKTGEVEMGPVGVALKATKAAAVLRNVRVA